MNNINKLTAMFAAACFLSASAASAQDIKVTRSGDTTIVKITNPKKYLILPVEETKDESHVLLSSCLWQSGWVFRSFRWTASTAPFSSA